MDAQQHPVAGPAGAHRRGRGRRRWRRLREAAADEERVTKAFQLILKDPKVKAVLVNIFGGIVKCDMIAAGILAALKKVHLRVPLVVRLQGTNVEKGRELLSGAKVKIVSADDLWDAAQKAVEVSR